MKMIGSAIGLAGLALLALLAVSGPASAETSQQWCEFSGGTWRGFVLSDGSSSTSKGICSFTMVVRDPGPVARARARAACTNVGGTLSETGGKQICAVSSANSARVKASADFRSATSRR